MPLPSKIPVLWYTDRNNIIEFEAKYIRELLSQYEGEVTYRDVKDQNDIEPYAIILTNQSVNYMQYLYNYEVQKCPFIVIHISDEHAWDDIRYCSFSMCGHSFKNYCHPKLFNIFNNLTFFPSGYNKSILKDYTGEAPLDISFAKRKYIWSFAGGSEKLRGHIMNKFVEHFPNDHYLLYETGSSYHNQQTGLSIDKYRDMVFNTKFSICPPGGGYVESFRVYEVLECGGIPVVLRSQNKEYEQKRSYWGDLYGNEPPFVMADTWEGCIEIMKYLLQNEDIYEKTRRDCYNFWQDHKKQKGQEIVNAWKNLASIEEK